MEWNFFNKRTPALNAFIIATDGKQIALYQYPNTKPLFTDCHCTMNLADCEYWIYISELPRPE